MLSLFELAGAVTLLLWGLRMVRAGCSGLLGDRLERTLRRATQNRPKAFLVGLGGALTMQSSTAVVLMVSGFAAGSMMTLYAALGVILGAEVGASIAALFLNLEVRAFAPAFIALGYVIYTAARRQTLKHAGQMVLGLGFVLLALALLSQASDGLQNSELFAAALTVMANDHSLAFVLMALMTWLMHSTLAAVLILAQFVENGTISFSLALVLLLGANLGGALPALVAGWSMPGNGRAVVLANLIFRFVVVSLGAVILLWIGMTTVPGLEAGGSALVWLHFGINLLGGLILLTGLPFYDHWMQRLAHRSKKHSFTISDQGHRSIYLSAEDQSNPSRALANARNEAVHIADVVYQMLRYTPEAFKDESVVQQIRRLDDDIDSLHREALLYIVSIDNCEDRDMQEVLRLQSNEIIDFMTNLEHIGDIIESSLMHLARSKMRLKINFTKAQENIISELHSDLVDSFRLSQAVFTSGSYDMAKELLATKREYRSNILRIRRVHIESLSGDISENMAATQIFMDVLRDLQRVSSHLTAVAYQVIKNQNELKVDQESLVTQ